MPTGIGCTVYADGRQLADGCAVVGPADPEVLSGLEIVWGRDTTVDQPEASTCSFQLLDPPGGGSFVDRLRTGTRIDVTATGTSYPDPTEPVWPDPGFETGLPGTTRTNATVSRSSRRRKSGQYALRMAPVDPARRASTIIAPAPFSPPGTAPDAWDDIPTTSPGQTWSYGASLFAPAGAIVQLRPALFTGPYPGAATVIDRPLTAIGTGTGVVTATRTNLIPNPRYIGRDGVQGGGAADWTQEDIDTGGPDGRGYTRITATSEATGVVDIGASQDATFPVTPGQAYTASVHMLAEDATVYEFYVYLRWQRADGSSLGNVTNTPATVVGHPGPDQWYRLDVTGAVAPDEAAQAQVRARLTYSADEPVQVGQQVGVACRLAEQSATLGTYFDGDTPDTETTTYAWTGEPNASTSVAASGDGGDWVTLSDQVVPDTAGAWVGLHVSSYPTGRVWDELPADVAWDQFDPTWTWDDFGAVFVDDVTVLAPAEGTASTVLVYSGRVIALDAGWDTEAAAPVISVDCVDFTADMDNVDIGDEPWQVEPMGDRFTRIVTATGMGVVAEIDDSVSGVLVSWRDVDAQPATGLLAELASSVDAVMWSATHQVTGPYLRVEDPSNRLSQYLLTLDDGVVVIIPNPGQTAGMQLPACDVLRDDVTWTQDASDVVTRAAVTWREQGVDDEGQPTTTDRTVTLIDTGLEARYGVRRLSLSTQLQSADDATAVAARLLARTSMNDWRASQLTVDDAWLDDADEVTVARLLTLLDGTSRNGLALTLDGLPQWAPTGDTVPVYLEGGKYEFSGGLWALALTVSNATAQGASAQWDELDPAWTWDQFGDITWNDLRGVGVAPSTALEQQGA